MEHKQKTWSNQCMRGERMESSLQQETSRMRSTKAMAEGRLKRKSQEAMKTIAM